MIPLPLRRWLIGWAVAVLAGCAALPDRQVPPPSHAIQDVSATRLAAVLRASGAPADDRQTSGFRLLADAAFSLDARIALARAAQRTLDVQYYLLERDEVGLALLRELRDAAARGVRVRLLVDDLYAGREDMLFAALARQPGIEVRMFNPLPARGGSAVSRLVRSLHEFERINHRMHNKLFVADNSFSVSGGRNIAADYFMRSGTANFIDVDVLAAGAVVQAQSEAFDRYWNNERVWPVQQLAHDGPPASAADDALGADDASTSALPQGSSPRDALGRTPVSTQLAEGRFDLTWAQGTLFVDDPEKIARTSFEARFSGSVTERTLGVIRSAQRKVVIVSPYFIPGEIGMEVITDAARRGVSTTLITNSLSATDEPLVYAGYARYRPEMLRQGVIIYEIGSTLSRRSKALGDFGASTGRLHAKLAVIDERWIFVGSMNLDGRSASLNTETGILIDSPPLVADFDALIRADRFASAYFLQLGSTGRVQWVEQSDQGHKELHLDEPGTNWFIELKNWLLSPFVREELL